MLFGGGGGGVVVALSVLATRVDGLAPTRRCLGGRTKESRLLRAAAPAAVVEVEEHRELLLFGPGSKGVRKAAAVEEPEALARAARWGRSEWHQTQALRLLLASLSVAALLVPPARRALDDAVAQAWAAVYARRFAHSNMFEAFTATGGFVAAILFWSAVHLVAWGPRRTDWTARFRLDGAKPVAPFEFFGQLGWRRFAGAWLPLVAYVGSIFVFHGLVKKAPLPVAAPSFLRLVSETVSGLVAYDLAFAPIHRSLHSQRAPAFWRGAHRTHHEARPLARRGRALAPLETVQHSYLDGALQVMTNVAVQRFLRIGGLAKHPLSRVAHNLLVTYLLVEAHSGYDLPWMSHRVAPKGLLAGSLAHDAHHLTSRPHYHQFFDDALFHNHLFQMWTATRRRLRPPRDNGHSSREPATTLEGAPPADVSADSRPALAGLLHHQDLS